MRQWFKNALNWFFMKTISYRLVHNQLAVDSDMDAWKSLRNKGFVPRVIVDVGAAQGVWTIQMLKIFPDSQYLMVDPLQENQDALMMVAEKCPGVKYWQGALGRQAGELQFFVHGDQSSMFDSEWGRHGSMRSVPMKTLDDLLKEKKFERIDGLKLDVQGAELEVLSGAAETLKKCAVVQVEVSFRKVYANAPLAHEVIHFFADNGFRIFDITAAYKRKDRALLQADLFFVRDDRLFDPETWEIA